MDDYRFETPVLVMGWRRPQHLRQVISALSVVRPKKVWLAIDGASNAIQAPQVAETQAVALRSITWDCSLRTLFQDSNLGCRQGVITAIDWFLAEAKEGIILEDDCVVSADGLRFMAELLDRYRHNERVLSVSADNSLGVRVLRPESYFFSGFPHIWGWATWDSAWKKYDRDMSLWRSARVSGKSADFFPSEVAEAFWTPLFDRVTFEPREDTWDWQWIATHFAHRALAVQSATNFVTNIGFDDLATHTRSRTTRSNRPAQTGILMRHPHKVQEDSQVRAQTYRLLNRVRTRKTWPRISLMRFLARVAVKFQASTNLGGEFGGNR